MGEIRILLCDDEEGFARSLGKEIHTFFTGKGIVPEITWCGSGERLKQELSEHSAPDLLFMDIDLGTADGVNVVKELRAEQPGLPVIFLSGLEERVLDGYDVKAFYFLFKRDYGSRLVGVLERFLSEYFYAGRIAVKDGAGIKMFSLQEICYVEAEGRSTKLHTASGMFFHNEALSGFVKQLPGELFIEVYHCLYVNVDHISRVDADSLLLDTGEEVPVSRRKRKSVVEAVMKRLVAE